MNKKSATLYKHAKKRIPSGVNSPVRAFKAVGGTPLFMEKGKGPFIWDVAGKRYIDYCCSWGPLLFGHAPQGMIAGLKKAMDKGTSFGAATAKEVKLAEEIHKLFPSVEKSRLVSSGTEAVMSAIRLARGFTGRKKILKIDGGYHGHVDSLLIKAGSGAATFGTPDSAGIPEELSKLTLTLPFNDIKQLEQVFRKHGKQIAAFILEPVPGNMGTVIPEKNYLKKVRSITKKYGTVLIFDEVMTGFRISRGGAQQHFGVKPDLTCLGKIIGGGFPLAAFGGRARIMDCLAPHGAVYQAGTLSGNPVAVNAALWMLKQVRQSRDYNALLKRTRVFYEELRDMIHKLGEPVELNAIASMFTLFFTDQKVTDYASAKTSDVRRHARFFHQCLNQGIYVAPSQFEANFISTSHKASHLEKTLKSIKKAIKNSI